MTNPFLLSATIKKRIGKLRHTQAQLRAVFDRENRKLDNQVADLQSRCEHPKVKQERAEPHYSHRYPHFEYVCQVCGYRSMRPLEPDHERAQEVVKLQAQPRAGGGLR
jgi:hypothetical protein